MTETDVHSGEETSILRKKSLKGEIFELLHQRIVAGRYLPGEWLRQEELATQLGVSQTPVREALDLLVSVGLAERVPYRGVRVPEPNQFEIIDAYSMRLLLECIAGSLAAQNRSTEQVAILTDLIEQTRTLVRLEDMSAQRRLNKQFHQLIAEASGSLLLSKQYEMVSNIFPDWMLYEYMFRHPELLQTSLEQEYQEHQNIVIAITSQDSRLAMQYIATHIHNLGQELVHYLNIPLDLLEEKEALIAPILKTGNLHMP